MKMIFLVAVIGSVGYLFYQEFPQVREWLQQNDHFEHTVAPVKDSLEDSLKEQLDTLIAEREALYELLAEKEALLMQEHTRNDAGDGAANEAGQQVSEPDKAVIPVNDKMRRRQALIELAERMELHALGIIE